MIQIKAWWNVEYDDSYDFSAFIMHPIYSYEKRRARHKLDCTFTRRNMIEYACLAFAFAHLWETPLKHIAPTITWWMPIELVGYRNVSSIFIISTDSLFTNMLKHQQNQVIGLHLTMERCIKNNNKLHHTFRIFNRFELKLTCSTRKTSN